jgi:hypothetical protein
MENKMPENPKTILNINSRQHTGDIVGGSKFVNSDQIHNDIHIIKSGIEAKINNKSQWETGIDSNIVPKIIQSLKDLNKSLEQPRNKSGWLRAIQNLKAIITAFPGSILLRDIDRWNETIEDQE